MNLQLYFLLTISCAINFWITYAYRPFVALAKSKASMGTNIALGLLRSVSDIWPSTSSYKRPKSYLNMMRVCICRYLFTSVIFSNFISQLSSPSTVSSQDFASEMMSWLKESLHLSKATTSVPKEKSESAAPFVPGYMDYDPKRAAMISHRIAHNKRVGSHSSFGKWFEH